MNDNLLLTPEEISEALEVGHTEHEGFVLVAKAQLTKAERHYTQKDEIDKQMSGEELIGKLEQARKEERERVIEKALKAMEIFNSQIIPNPYTILRQALREQ